MLPRSLTNKDGAGSRRRVPSERDSFLPSADAISDNFARASRLLGPLVSRSHHLAATLVYLRLTGILACHTTSIDMHMHASLTVRETVLVLTTYLSHCLWFRCRRYHHERKLEEDDCVPITVPSRLCTSLTAQFVLCIKFIRQGSQAANTILLLTW